MSFHRRATWVFAVTMVALGVVLIAETVRVGGGSLGAVAGAMFVAVGAARIYLLRRR